MSDLRQLLETAKADAPPARYGVDDIVAAGRRRRRRIRIQRIGGAGALVVAVVAGTVFAVGHGPARDNPADRRTGTVELPLDKPVDIPPLTFMFGPFEAGKYSVHLPQYATTSYQVADITTEYQDAAGKTAVAFVGDLTVYRPGAPPPSVFLSGTPIKVHGRPGFANLRPGNPRATEYAMDVYYNLRSIDALSLAWQYADNSWAVINSVISIAGEADYRMTEADERALAEKFNFGAPVTARIPFQVGHMPDGWQVVSVAGQGFTETDYGIVTVILAPASVAAQNNMQHHNVTVDYPDGPIATIIVGRKQEQSVPDAPKNPPTCGKFAEDYLSCTWTIPNTDFYLIVQDASSTLSKEDLMQIGQSLTFDNLNAPETWHPAL